MIVVSLLFDQTCQLLTALAKLKPGVDDLQIKDIQGKQKMLSACEDLQVGSIPAGTLTSLRQCCRVLRTENLVLPPWNKALISKTVGLAYYTDGKMKAWILVVSLASGDDSDWHADIAAHFNLIPGFVDFHCSAMERRDECVVAWQE